MVLQRVSVSCVCPCRWAYGVTLWELCTLGKSSHTCTQWRCGTCCHPSPCPSPCLSHTIRWLPLSHSQQ